MTISDILAQAKALSPQERKELATLLIDALNTGETATQPKTGAEIIAMFQAMEPSEFVDPHIEDSVEWVNTQRCKRADHLKPYRDEDE